MVTYIGMTIDPKQVVRELNQIMWHCLMVDNPSKLSNHIKLLFPTILPDAIEAACSGTYKFDYDEDTGYILRPQHEVEPI